MKKLPYGISNYEKIITNNYYYVDKTMYIEKLEELAEPSIMFLRPRKFGKTLFTSTLEYYYDIKAKDKFEALYGETYIGKNPTTNRNSYHVLRFNFSGIDTETEETTIAGFKNEVASSIKLFAEKYGLDFYVDFQDSAENILNNLFKAFYIQKGEEKIYVLIDEYDHFANELLSFNTSQFRTLVSKNGKVRKWYEILKKGTESVVDRIFITGVAPITLDSLTSGFNICSDKTKDETLNSMLGFTKQELVTLMEAQEITEEKRQELLPILKENYDGYKFSVFAEEKIYNSNMCLYFLSSYVRLNRMPESMVDMNIASDYAKLGKMLDLCRGEKRLEILEKTVAGDGIITNITEKFNPEITFGDTEFCSMLFYLGYLTIADEKLGKPELKIPNLVMKEIYSNYFLQKVEKMSELRVEESDYNKMLEEIAIEGKIDALVNQVHRYLNNLSNRDFQRFDEKYVKLIFYCIAMNLKLFSVKSEMEVNRNYPDLMLVPRDKSKGYKAVMLELKYLKKDEAGSLELKQKEAKEQIMKYSEYEDIKNIPELSKYTVVAVNDEIYVEKI